MIMVQYLFGRPGFQQDPVADTSDDAIIGAHCSCPTRLNGFDNSPEPFDLVHHHGNRDAVPQTLWQKGMRVTSVDVLPGGDPSFRKGVDVTDRPSRVLIAQQGADLGWDGSGEYGGAAEWRMCRVGKGEVRRESGNIELSRVPSGVFLRRL